MTDKAKRSEKLGTNSATKNGPATMHFAARLRELLTTHNARDQGTGRSRRANPKSLSEILVDQTDGRGISGISQSQLYRLERGIASPNIEAVYEIAKAFRVPPRSFLPDDISDQKLA